MALIKVRSTDAWNKVSKKEFSEIKWYQTRQRGQHCNGCGAPTVWGWCQVCTPEALPDPVQHEVVPLDLSELPYINGRLHPRRRQNGKPRQNYDSTWHEDEVGLTVTQRRMKRKREYKRAKDAARRSTRPVKPVETREEKLARYAANRRAKYHSNEEVRAKERARTKKRKLLAKETRIGG